MKKFCFAAGMLAAVALLASVLSSFRLPAGTVNTQNFTPARYAVLAAPVHVAMQSGGGRYEQNTVVKIDTVTGEAWVLQLSVRSSTDPTVMGAVWAPVSRNAQNAPNTDPGAF